MRYPSPKTILRAWQQRDHTRYRSWCVSRMDEAKAGRVYRPVAEGWAQLTNKVIRACGYQNGDCTRDKFNLKTVRRYDGTTWLETPIRELHAYRADILRTQSKATVTNTQTAIVTTNPADPEPTFDSTGMPLPSQFDLMNTAVVSYTMYEQEAWKRTNWKGYAEHITKWPKWYERKNSPVPVAMEPISKHELHLRVRLGLLTREL